MNLQDYRVQPALCLDFDGTIRHSKEGTFINKVEDILLYPDVEPKLWEYRNLGFLILGITNQGGVAFGYKSMEQMQAELDATLALFTQNPFDAVQVSLSHPKGTVPPLNQRSLLRKPDIGMLAVSEVQMFHRGVMIDWDRSIFVGDRPEDEECAQRAGIHFIHSDVFFGRV